MKRIGWGLLALSAVLLLMAGVQAGRVADQGNPSGELAEKLGAFTCPVIVFIPALVLIVLGSRARHIPPQHDKKPPRETEDFEVLDD